VTSALTPRRGYRLIIRQVEGERPSATVDCSRCDYLEPVPLVIDDHLAQLGKALHDAVELWRAHPCKQALVGTDINEPQAYPADAATPERTSK
jgi:hypothetical protein